MLNKIVNVMTLGLVALLVAGTVVMPLSVLAQTQDLTGSITSPADGSTFQVGETINFTASASGGVTPYTYLWVIDEGQAFGSSINYAFDTVGIKTVNVSIADNANGEVSHSITVNIVEDDTEDLTISNIRIENVTSSGVTIKWTTNRPATSRVVYDTQSHPNISGASAPNYGYANSTGTSDTNPKVTEHTVTLSGLNANTQYFFRVISEE